MALRFSSGSVTPASRSKKRSAARTWMSSMPWWRRKVSTTWLALVLAQQAGVHEDARELRTDGLVQQGRGHGRVHAAGQAADHPVVAHLGADRLDRVSMKLAIVQSPGRPARS